MPRAFAIAAVAVIGCIPDTPIPVAADQPPGGVWDLCGNATCDAPQGEKYLYCPSDCDAPECGNGTCEPGETASTCAADCDPGACGNELCTAPETANSCPADCSATCGDGICGFGEGPASCELDCVYDCGDGECVAGWENPVHCPEDCATL